jgi:hypothetical protein
MDALCRKFSVVVLKGSFALCGAAFFSCQQKDKLTELKRGNYGYFDN